jgi:hypothetical protein
LDALTVNLQEIPWRDFSQVRIARDLLRSSESPVREISLSQSLQAPGDAPEEMFPVSASGRLLKQLAELRAQIG